MGGKNRPDLNFLTFLADFGVEACCFPDIFSKICPDILGPEKSGLPIYYHRSSRELRGKLAVTWRLVLRVIC
jgi:hypothetical protein